ERDVAGAHGERDDVAVLFHRLPAEALHSLEQCADAVGAFIGQAAQRLAVEGELLVLGADAPIFHRLAALLEVFEELALAGDGFAARFRWRGHAAASSTSKAIFEGSAGTVDGCRPCGALPRISAPAGAPGHRRELPASRRVPQELRCRREAHAAPDRPR